MLALALPNALGVVLFGGVYWLAAGHLLTQAAFLAALLGVFALMTTLWLRIERTRNGRLPAVQRLGRIAIGMALVLIVAPVAVLTPLFGMARLLPEEAGLAPVLAPIMFILLVSLALTVLVNVAGVLMLTGAALAGRFRWRRPPS